MGRARFDQYESVTLCTYNPDSRELTNNLAVSLSSINEPDTRFSKKTDPPSSLGPLWLRSAAELLDLSYVQKLNRRLVILYSH